MTRLAVGFAVLGIVLSAPDRAPGDDYAPADGRFSVRFPGTPKESTQKTKSPIGELKVFAATYATSDGSAYLASYTDFPPGSAGDANRTALFDGARDGLKGKDGKVLAEKDVEVGTDKLPGREVELELEKGKRLRVRFALRGDRLYQVAVAGSADFAGGKNATAFLDSFDTTK